MSTTRKSPKSARQYDRVMAMIATVGLIAELVFGDATGTTGRIANPRTEASNVTVAIVMDTRILNLRGCPAPDGSIVDAEHPGYETFSAAAQPAFAQRVQVEIAIDRERCQYQRPVIGLNLVR